MKTYDLYVILNMAIFGKRTAEVCLDGTVVRFISTEMFEFKYAYLAMQEERYLYAC